MEMIVRRAGMLTTVQDLGRTGHRAAGVPLSGAMDSFALRVANSLVGNPENAAGLECSYIGPELEFSADTVIAVTGAEIAGLPPWKPVMVRAGERVTIGPCTHGARVYVAVAGGIDVPLVMGSRSTYLRAKIGGLSGRPLREGDVLAVRPVRGRIEQPAQSGSAAGSTAAHVAAWTIDPRILPAYSDHPVVRVITGAHAGEFDRSWRETSYRVSAQSDRMGLRLTGPALARSNPHELLSMPLLPGTIQVPPDGQPLVLMADAQTIGGYPQLAHVIGVDLPVVAQLRPGDAMRFAEVTLAEAHRLATVRERAISILREGLAEKLAGRATT